MDTDWCLTCNKHLDGYTSSPYCCVDCRHVAGPSHIPYDIEPSMNDSLDDEDDVVYHHVEETYPSLHYTGNDYDGITAWAAAIPPGAPVRDGSRSPSTRSRASSRRSSISQLSPKTLTSRPPDLLKPHRPLAPALCITTTPKPTPSKPSRPIGAHLPPALESTKSAAYSTSTGRTTDSSLATPASVNAMAHSVFETLTSQVLSWVAPSPIHTTSHSPIDFTPIRFSQQKPSQKSQERTLHDLQRGRAASRLLVA